MFNILIGIYMYIYYSPVLSSCILNHCFSHLVLCPHRNAIMASKPEFFFLKWRLPLLTLALKPACQIILCRGAYLFYIQFVTCTFYYNHDISTKLVWFIPSNHLMELNLLYFPFYTNFSKDFLHTQTWLLTPLKLSPCIYIFLLTKYVFVCVCVVLSPATTKQALLWLLCVCWHGSFLNYARVCGSIFSFLSLQHKPSAPSRSSTVRVPTCQPWPACLHTLRL